MRCKDTKERLEKLNEFIRRLEETHDKTEYDWATLDYLYEDKARLEEELNTVGTIK